MGWYEDDEFKNGQKAAKNDKGNVFTEATGDLGNMFPWVSDSFRAGYKSVMNDPNYPGEPSRSENRSSDAADSGSDQGYSGYSFSSSSNDDFYESYMRARTPPKPVVNEVRKTPVKSCAQPKPDTKSVSEKTPSSQVKQAEGGSGLLSVGIILAGIAVMAILSDSKK